MLRTCVAKKLSKGKEGAMDVLEGVGVAGQAALRLLKQAVVPHHPVARLALLHQHQACLPRMSFQQDYEECSKGLHVTVLLACHLYQSSDKSETV